MTLLCVVHMQAQEVQVLHGQIVTDSLEQFKVDIINKTVGTGTVSRPDGQFEIKVNLGDDLLFSAIGYRDYSLKVTQEILQNDSLTITLKPEVNMLGTVYLSNKDLTGDLSKDAHILHFFDQSKLGLASTVPKDRPIAQRRYDLATSGGVIGVLVNAISGRTKRLKKQLQNFKNEQLKKKALQILGEDFYTKDLGLPSYKVQNFLYFCLDDEQFKEALDKGKISLMAFMFTKVKQYKKRTKMF